MATISQANRGAPAAGPLGSASDRPAAPGAGANPLQPSGGGSLFEQLHAKAGGGQAGGEQAVSKEQKEVLDRQQKLAEALEKGDAGKLRDLAKDQKTMAAATPEQKAALLTSLRCEVNNKGKGTPADREAIVNVLKSAGSDAEYQAMIQQAGGPDVVREAMTLGAGEDSKGPFGMVIKSGDDKLLATFDVIAGAHGCSAYATDPATAALGEKARSRGYTADQIVAARSKSVGAHGDSPRVKGAADDPLAMLVTTPKEKSEMLLQLMDGWTKDSDDRGMVSILQSCEGKAEFDQVIDGAGGRAVIDELDDDEAKKKANQLAGAYERLDCATDSKVARSTYGDLTNPARVQHLLNGADSGVVQAQAQPRSGDLADDFIRQHQADTAAKVATLDRRAQVETVLGNSEREAQGKPLIDPRGLRAQVSEVMADPALKDDEKEKRVDQLRKDTGLDDYTMRNLATQPLARIYEDATQQAARFAAVGEALETQKAMQVVARFGADSPQAALALQAMARFKDEMAPYVSTLQGAAKKLEDLYPPPKGFWESALGVLGDIAKTFGPALLNLIPGVGTALFIGYEAVMTVVDAAQGKWLAALTDIAGVLPGLGTVGKIAGAAIKGGVGVEQAIERGDVLGVVGALGAAAGGVAGAAGSPAVQDIAEITRDAAAITKGIKDGDIAQILNGAGNLTGLDAKTKDLLTGGAGALQSFARGDAAGGLAGLSGLLGGLNDPTAAELSGLALQGSRFARALQTGDLGAALAGVEGLAQQLGAGPAVDQLKRAFEPLARMGLTEQNAAAALDFVRALGKGDLGAALQDAQGLAQRVGGGAVADQLQQVMARAGVSPENVKAALDFVQGQDARAVVDFARSVARGDVGQALLGLGNEAARIAGSPELQKAMGFVQDGAAVVGALQQGHFSGAMERLGVPPREVEAVRQAEQLVKALQAGDLNALARTAPAQQLLQSAQALAQKLGDGRALDAFARFGGALDQLRAAAVPGLDQALVERANQLLAQAAQLTG